MNSRNILAKAIRAAASSLNGSTQSSKKIYLENFGTFNSTFLPISNSYRSFSSTSNLQRKRKSPKSPPVKKGSGSGSSSGKCPKCGSPLDFFWQSPNEANVTFHICTNKACQIVVLSGSPPEKIENDMNDSAPGLPTLRPPKRSNYDEGLGHRAAGKTSSSQNKNTRTATDALNDEFESQ